jgi:hypothetical protein
MQQGPDPWGRLVAAFAWGIALASPRFACCLAEDQRSPPPLLALHRVPQCPHHSCVPQVELPDYWLDSGNPWEIRRPETQFK